MPAVHGPGCDATVVTVRLAVAGFALVMFTGEVEPKLIVGMLTAPVGLEVMLAASVTVPVNPFVGATVMGNVLFVVAPAVTEIVGLLTVKPISAMLTFTVVVPVAVL